MSELVTIAGELGVLGVTFYFLWYFMKKYEEERKYNRDRDEQHEQIIVGLINFLLENDEKGSRKPFKSDKDSK